MGDRSRPRAWRASIRIRLIAALAACALAPALARAASTEPVVVLTEAGRRQVTPVVHGSAELVPIEAVLAGQPVTFRNDAQAGSVTLASGGREVTLYQGKNLASVGGDLRLLSSASLVEGGRWLVPVDSLPRLLGPLLGVRVEWRPPTRALLVGRVALPRVTVRSSVTGTSAQVVFEATPRVSFQVQQEQGRVSVSVPGEVIDTPFTQERLTGGIVDSVRYEGGRDNVFVVSLGPRFQAVTPASADGRVVLDFAAGGPAPVPGPSGAPSAAPAPGPSMPPPGPASSGVRTIVIDAGHGGAEVGAKGPGGTLEKDVTLAVARRLRASLANSLGVQVFLTRDVDKEVSLDERTAIANNYKADLFVSIHCNASRSPAARGSEVYFLSQTASDEESRRLALAEGSALPSGGAASAGSSDLALILWDMAQNEHVAESSVLATRIQEQLAEVTGSQGRGVKQAPFRVLVGAGMPAVLVEVAFISNPDEEKQLASEAYQSKVVAAVQRGVAAFLAQRSGAPHAETGGR